MIKGRFNLTGSIGRARRSHGSANRQQSWAMRRGVLRNSLGNIAITNKSDTQPSELAGGSHMKTLPGNESMGGVENKKPRSVDSGAF